MQTASVVLNGYFFFNVVQTLVLKKYISWFQELDIGMLEPPSYQRLAIEKMTFALKLSQLDKMQQVV